MSTLKVNKLRDTAGSADAITLDPNGGAVLAGVTTVTSVKVGAAVTISESGIEASGIGITCANINGQQIGGRRNIVINGAMRVAQRGTSFTDANSQYTLDRFRYYRNLDTGEVTVSQEDVTDLVGFTKAIKINTTTAETGIPSKSGEKYATLLYRVEAQDLQHISNGTSSAKPLTLSFYAKSNVTGTFCVSLYKGDNTARLISLPYTINSANTWEQKTLSIPGDTSGSGINNDTGEGIAFYWIFARAQGYQGTTSTSWINYTATGWAPLCTGSIFENVNDHIFITGVQLEVGSQPTAFEHRSHGEELQLCARYFQQFEGGSNSLFATGFTATNDFYGGGTLPMGKMRAAPTIAVDGTLSHLNYTHVAIARDASSITNQGSGDSSFVVRLQSTSTTTDNAGAYARITDSSTNLTFDAEI